MQKPDPGNPAAHHRTRPAATSQRAVMVGDSGTDIATARAAGIPVVAVDFGYTETPVRELGPDRVISALSELPDAVFDLLRAGSRPGSGTSRSR